MMPRRKSLPGRERDARDDEKVEWAGKPNSVPPHERRLKPVPHVGRWRSFI